MADDSENDVKGPLAEICAYFETVLGNKNLGEHLNDVFADRDRMLQAIRRHVPQHPPPGKQYMTSVPTESMDEFWLPISRFDYSSSAKDGFFPNNSNFRSHYKEFVVHGCRSSYEAIQCKFPLADSNRVLLDWSTGFVDGMTKIMLCLCIIGFCEELEFTDEQLRDPDLRRTLDSFGAFRCSYQHFDNQGHHFLNAIKVGFVTSEKTAPTPIQLVASVGHAIDLERRGNPKLALKDGLNRVCAAFNKMVSNKKHRLDGSKKALVYNLLRSTPALLDAVHAHYGSHKPETSGLQPEALAMDFWVPGVHTRAENHRFRGKPQLEEVLCTTKDTAELFFQRAMEDFNRKVSKTAAQKAKKFAMLDIDGLVNLHDIVCLWIWLRERLQRAFPMETVAKYENLFQKGSLDNDLGTIMKCGEEFDWQRINFVLEIKGETLENFVSQAQCSTKNAMERSLEAAFQAWQQQLISDQAVFQNELILSERETVKARAALVKSLEDSHTRAWTCVREFMDSNMRVFTGRTSDPESTVLPAISSWIDTTLEDCCVGADGFSLVIFLNAPSCGIVGTEKQSFFVTAITNLLTQFRRTAIALIVLPNRAGQQNATRKTERPDDGDTKVEDDDEVKKDEGSESGQDTMKAEEADVRDVKYQFEKEFSLKDRGLKVRDLTFAFDPESIYGKRSGFLPGLAITSRDKTNQFRESKLWKQGIVHNISMLSRNQMFKPEVSPSKTLPHLGRAMTDIQELKQVANGSDFVRRTLAALSPTGNPLGSAGATMLIDLHAYDGSPGIASLEEMAENRKVFCGSVVLGTSPDTIVSRLANKIYADCRAKKLSISQLPDYEPTIQALKSGGNRVDPNTYKVCVPQGGKLLVLQSLAQKWVDQESTSTRASELIAGHNEKFNDSGEYWACERAGASSAQERPAKRIKIESSDKATMEEVSKLVDPHKVSINSCAELCANGDAGDYLILVSKGSNAFLQGKEMFSFGAGEWRDGQEAADVMRDATGRWVSFVVSGQSLLLVERKTVPDHLAALSSLDTVASLDEILLELQDAGEVKVDVSHHKRVDSEWASAKPLVFVLDPVKDLSVKAEDKPKKRKAEKSKAPSVNLKNYGARLDMGKVKASSKLTLAWRARIDGNNTDGIKTIIPIRPITILSGSIELNDEAVRLF